jgi:uncharacterized protein (TIGR02118 family)
MPKLLVLYGKPKDPAQFDAHYFAKHVPMAKRLPGLRRYEVSAGPINMPQGGPPYHLVAQLEFESMQALGAAMASPEGKAVGADLANFASGGADLLVFETREV